ncbi:MAG: hypothetical protein AAF922_18125 [Pseudomonadota bacterium]
MKRETVGANREIISRLYILQLVLSFRDLRSALKSQFSIGLYGFEVLLPFAMHNLTRA